MRRRKANSSPGKYQPATASCAARSAAACKPGLLCRLVVREEGYINFVSCFLFMAFVLGLALVGNVGGWTNDRLDLQNAADSAAYSSSLQMARGMNAITATNHMMGQVTALVVTLESFVGRERLRNKDRRDQPIKDNDDVEKADEAIEKSKDGAPYPEPNVAVYEIQGYGRALHNADSQYVEQIYKLFVTQDFFKQRSDAAMFDSQVALKHRVALALTYKQLCTLLNQGAQKAIAAGNVPILAWLKIIGWIGEAAATGGHIWLDVQIAGMAKEWVVLNAVERALLLPIVPECIELCESVVIPALSYHSDSVAGMQSSDSKDAPVAIQAPTNRAIEQTITLLANKFSATQFATYPVPADIVLPVEPEKTDKEEDQPTAPGGSSSDNRGEELWKAGAKNVSDDAANGPMQQIKDRLQPVADIINQIYGSVKPLLDFLKRLQELTSWQKFAGDLVEDWSGYDIDGIVGDLGEISGYLGKAVNIIEQLSKKDPSPIGFDHNPSKEDLLKDPFDWEAEKKSQWARATFPYVVSSRTPIREFFRDAAGISNASTYFANWSNRYTLVDSYHIRHDKKKDDGKSSDQKKQKDPKRDDAESKWQKFVKELTGLADQFDQFSNEPEIGDTGGTASAGPFDDAIDKISQGIERLAANTQGDAALIEQMLGAPIAKWIERAKQHRQKARDYAAAQEYSPDYEMTQDEFTKIAQAAALSVEVDELLKMLSREIEKLKQLLAIPFQAPPHMYIIRGSSPDTKGQEDWATIKAPLEAERLFTLVAYAQRSGTPRPRFLENMFAFSREGRICLAQAIVYNANGRKLEENEAGRFQPNTGWDTLNWEPPVKAPEWGEPTDDGGPGRLPSFDFNVPSFPFDVFTGRKVESCAKAKLNWQSKLIPLTASRFRTAVDSNTLPDFIQSQLEKIEDEDFESLVHH